MINKFSETEILELGSISEEFELFSDEIVPFKSLSTEACVGTFLKKRLFLKYVRFPAVTINDRPFSRTLDTVPFVSHNFVMWGLEKNNVANFQGF